MSADAGEQGADVANKEKVRKHPNLAEASTRLVVAMEALFDSDGWGGPDEEPRVSEVGGD